MINHIIVNNLYDEDYVETHTNALFLGDAEFDFKDGVFSGFDAEQAQVRHEDAGAISSTRSGRPQRREEPRRPALHLRAAEDLRLALHARRWESGSPASRPRRSSRSPRRWRRTGPGTILYALGMTQHTTGVQGIRAFTILQLLLGNIGKPGGGVNALRGEPNVQGACDMGVLNNYMPGYLDYPSNAEPTLDDYAARTAPRAASTSSTRSRRSTASGDAENEFGYEWLPKGSRPRTSSFGIFESALAGQMKMLWIIGQNPAVTSPNLKIIFEGMDKLETLVVQELWETETAAFWHRPGVDPKTIQTEVFLLPAAFFMEKNGTITNSGAMVQWRHKAVNPPGQARADGEIVDFVFRRVRDFVINSNDPKDEIIKKAYWTYTTPEDVLREISGRALQDFPGPPSRTARW